MLAKCSLSALRQLDVKQELGNLLQWTYAGGLEFPTPALQMGSPERRRESARLRLRPNSPGNALQADCQRSPGRGLVHSALFTPIWGSTHVGPLATYEPK